MAGKSCVVQQTANRIVSDKSRIIEIRKDQEIFTTGLTIRDSGHIAMGYMHPF
jgi:hypothetical protein